jgi:Mat/Ecp fimbriae periplasmic chaperone
LKGVHKVAKVRLIVAGLFILLTTQALAQIAVTPIILNFKAGQLPRKDVLVVNTGKRTVYVRVTPKLIEHPGTKQEKAVEMVNPEKLGLLATPNRLVIPKGQSRNVRLMLTQQPGKTDRIYRVTIAPVASSLIPTKVGTRKDNIGIHILIAYDVLTMVRAQNPHPDIKITRRGNRLTVTNKGNSNILIAGGKQCFKKACEHVSPHRVYAGNTWTTTLKYKTPVTLNTDYLGKIEKIKTS